MNALALLLAVIVREPPARVPAPPLRRAAVRVDEPAAADAILPFPERDALLLQRGERISLLPLERAAAETPYASAPRDARPVRAFLAQGRAFLAFNAKPPFIRDVERGTDLELSGLSIDRISLNPAQTAAIVTCRADDHGHDALTWWRPRDGAHRTLPATWEPRQFMRDGAWMMFDKIILDMATGEVVPDANVDDYDPTRFDAADVASPDAVRYRCVNDNPCGYRIGGKRLRAPVEEIYAAAANDGHLLFLGHDHGYWLIGPDESARRFLDFTQVDRAVLLGRGRAAIAGREELVLYDSATHLEWSAFDGLPHLVIPDTAPPESRCAARFDAIIAASFGTHPADRVALVKAGEARGLSARELLRPGDPPLSIATTMLLTSSGERWQIDFDLGTSRDVFLHDSGNFVIASLMNDGRWSLRRVIVERR